MKKPSLLLLLIISILFGCSEGAHRIKREHQVLHASLNFNEKMMVQFPGHTSTGEAIYGDRVVLSLASPPDKEHILNVSVNQWAYTVTQYNCSSDEINTAFTLLSNPSEITLNTDSETKVFIPDAELAKEWGDQLNMMGFLFGILTIYVPEESEEFDIQVSIDMDVTVEYNAF